MSKWEMVKLGDYVDIKTGKLDANASSENGKYPFFTCSKEPLQIDTYSYDCECVLVAGNGDLNVKYYNGKFDAYQRTYIIESKNKQTLFVPYLYNFLDSYLETLRNQSIGGVIKYIKLGNLADAEIPLPPLETQKQIADELDKITSLIEKRKQQIEKLDLLIKAKFVEMFGDLQDYNKFEFSNIAKIVGGLTKNSKRNMLPIKMPYLRVANVYYNKLMLNEITEIGVNEREIEKNLVEKDDLLIVEGNGSIEQIGRVAIWNGDINPILHQNHLIKVRLNKDILTPKFCLFYLIMPQGREQIIRKSVSTSGLNTLSVNKIGSLEIPVPPLDLQNQFADYVEKVEKTKADMHKGLEKLEVLYKERMQNYFE